MLLSILVGCAGILWLAVLLAPWQPWRTAEILDTESVGDQTVDLSRITVLIPARNEAEHIQSTLSAIKKQSPDLAVIVIDDESTDGTAEVAQKSGLKNLKIIKGKEMPPYWTGKLWALEQGLVHVNTAYVLLLDADIELQPGILSALITKSVMQDIPFISLAAYMHTQSFWEKLLIPAFVYFFKLLYPFSLANQPRLKQCAAAAGGCILTKTSVLKDVGAFNSIRSAIIDDCTLAKRVKSKGYATWMGLTHEVISRRPYPSLASIWDMVARTAYTQLRYSILLLLLATVLMLFMFLLPIITLFNSITSLLSVVVILLMTITYLPMTRFYKLPSPWVLTLPLAGLLFLVMTWSSAFSYYRGIRSSWKGRNYPRRKKVEH